MKIKRLLPTFAIAATATTIAPIVASCSKTIKFEAEWDATELTTGFKEIKANQTYRINFDLAKWKADILPAELEFTVSPSRGAKLPNWLEGRIYINGKWQKSEISMGESAEFTIKKDDINYDKNTKISVELVWENDLEGAKYSLTGK